MSNSTLSVPSSPSPRPVVMRTQSCSCVSAGGGAMSSAISTMRVRSAWPQLEVQPARQASDQRVRRGSSNQRWLFFDEREEAQAAADGSRRRLALDHSEAQAAAEGSRWIAVDRTNAEVARLRVDDRRIARPSLHCLKRGERRPRSTRAAVAA